MKYKMFVSDFDWTLGHAPDIIEESTVDAIRRYQEKGGIFTVCTGRLFSSIRGILNKYGLKGTVIACQGAIVGDIETGKRVYAHGIEPKLAADTVKMLLDDGHFVMLDCNDVLYFSQRNAYTDAYEKLTSLHGVLLDDVPSFILKTQASTQKIMIMDEADKIPVLAQKYNEKFGGALTANSGAKCLMEIVNPKLNKGVSVEFLAEKFGVKKEEVLAIGDSTNDLSLMGRGFYGVAVGDGSEELRAAADEVTVPFEQKPVEVMLKKYCL